MNRRELSSAPIAFALALTFAAPAASARDLPHVEYRRDACEKARASGEPLLLDFFAEW